MATRAGLAQQAVQKVTAGSMNIFFFNFFRQAYLYVCFARLVQPATRIAHLHSVCSRFVLVKRLQAVTIVSVIFTFDLVISF